MSEIEEEYEGVTLNVEPDGWPNNLAGIIINDKPFYIVDGVVKIVGDPIWTIDLDEE